MVARNVVWLIRKTVADKSVDVRELSQTIVVLRTYDTGTRVTRTSEIGAPAAQAVMTNFNPADRR